MLPLFTADASCWKQTRSRKPALCSDMFTFAASKMGLDNFATAKSTLRQQICLQFARSAWYTNLQVQKRTYLSTTSSEFEATSSICYRCCSCKNETVKLLILLLQNSFVPANCMTARANLSLKGSCRTDFVAVNILSFFAVTNETLYVESVCLELQMCDCSCTGKIFKIGARNV